MRRQARDAAIFDYLSTFFIIFAVCLLRAAFARHAAITRALFAAAASALARRRFSPYADADFITIFASSLPIDAAYAVFADIAAQRSARC